MPSQTASSTRPARVRQPLNPYLLGVLRTFRASFASVFLFSFFINLLTLAVPLYLLQIYSKVLPSGNVDTLIFLTAMAVVAVVSLGLLEAIRRSLLAKAGARFERAVSEHLLDSAIRRAIAKSRASVNALRDLAAVRAFVAGSNMLPLIDLPWSPLFILILFVLHPVLGFIGAFGACLLFCLALLNERVTREPLSQSNRDSRAMLDDARAYVRNADVIEAMGLQGELLSRWNARGAEATVTSYRASRINTRLASLSKLVRLFLQIGIICAAAFLITRGELTAGATIASVLLLRRAVSPLEQSIRSWKSVLTTREAFRNISEYLDHASTLAPDSEMPVPDGALVAQRLSYRPSGAERSVFSRVDLELLPGKLTALVGPTATGKSSLLRVLSGAAKPNSGRVTLGGYDLAHWHAGQRGPYIGYLPQDVSLFPVTVRENIARLADAPIDEVVAAAERADAHAMIQALPAGYDTLVEEDGANLSGGQRQRIGFARALFGDPKVVLLDEPDANLDAEGRSALRKSLRRLRRSGVALLAITHHASLEKMADRVYRLERGKVRLERDDAKRRTSTDDGDGRTLAEEGLALIGPLPMAPLPAAISATIVGPHDVASEAASASFGEETLPLARYGSAGSGVERTSRGGAVTPLPRRVVTDPARPSSPPATSRTGAESSPTPQSAPADGASGNESGEPRGALADGGPVMPASESTGTPPALSTPSAQVNPADARQQRLLQRVERKRARYRRGEQGRPW